MFFPEISFAHNNPGYSHDRESKTLNPRWMKAIKDNVTISELSIPGTHDTMSFYGGDAVQTQTMSLENQLKSGVRVLDIRCRHVENVFAIHHGMVFQKVFFGDVLNIVTKFLDENTSETVLMRVKEEYDPERNTRTFSETFHYYWDQYQDYMWTPTPGYPEPNNPKLGDIRGKIVVLSRPSLLSEKYRIDYDSFQIQDVYELDTNWDLYSKWEKVKQHLQKANDANEDNTSKKYMNFLSGAGWTELVVLPIPTVYPYFVASGHSSPGTSASRLLTGRTTPGWNSWQDFPRVGHFLGMSSIAFEGTNVLTYERLLWEYRNRVGIIMADFPGPGLIERIIELNDRLKEGWQPRTPGWVHKGCVEFSNPEDVVNKGPITRVKVFYHGFIHGLQLYYGGSGGWVFGFQGFKDTDLKLESGEFVVPPGEEIVRIKGEVARNASGLPYVCRLHFTTNRGSESRWFGDSRRGIPFEIDDPGFPLKTISGSVNVTRHRARNRAITRLIFQFDHSRPIIGPSYPLSTSHGQTHKGCVEFSDSEDVINKGPITRIKVFYAGYIHGLQLYYGGYGGWVFGFQDFKDADVKVASDEFVVPPGEQIVRIKGELARNSSGFRYVSRLRFITNGGNESRWFGKNRGEPFEVAHPNGFPLKTISGSVNLRRHSSLNRAVASITFHFEPSGP